MSKRPIYYDTETTGLSPENDRIVEIAAYDPILKKSYQSLINPKIPIPSEATSIHHITDSMVEKAPTFDVVGNQLIEFCQGNCILVAHNNDAFDIHFLKAEFERANIQMPSWLFLDTLKWARKYRQDLPRHSLQYLREIYDIPPNQAHRALDDVIMLEKVFNKMIDDLDFDTVFDLLQKKGKSIRMPFGKHQGKLLKDIPKNYISWLAENNVFDKPQNKDLKEEFVKLGVLQ